MNDINVVFKLSTAPLSAAPDPPPGQIIPRQLTSDTPECDINNLMLENASLPEPWPAVFHPCIAVHFNRSEDPLAALLDFITDIIEGCIFFIAVCN